MRECLKMKKIYVIAWLDTPVCIWSVIPVLGLPCWVWPCWVFLSHPHFLLSTSTAASPILQHGPTTFHSQLYHAQDHGSSSQSRLWTNINSDVTNFNNVYLDFWENYTLSSEFLVEYWHISSVNQVIRLYLSNFNAWHQIFDPFSPEKGWNEIFPYLRFHCANTRRRYVTIMWCFYMRKYQVSSWRGLVHPPLLNWILWGFKDLSRKFIT